MLKPFSGNKLLRLKEPLQEGQEGLEVAPREELEELEGLEGLEEHRHPRSTTTKGLVGRRTRQRNS